MFNEIEEIRLKLDSLMRTTNYPSKIWNRLCEAKDVLGMAQIEITKLDEGIVAVLNKSNDPQV